MTLPIRAKPYRHQIEAYTFALKRLMDGGGAALLMEMGTGKTLTAIAIVGALLLLAGRAICALRRRDDRIHFAEAPSKPFFRAFSASCAYFPSCSPCAP